MTAPKIDLLPQPRPHCDHRFGRWVETTSPVSGVESAEIRPYWSRVCRECGMVETTMKKPRRRR